jgi:hypothetical protein
VTSSSNLTCTRAREMRVSGGQNRRGRLPRIPGLSNPENAESPAVAGTIEGARTRLSRNSPSRVFYELWVRVSVVVHTTPYPRESQTRWDLLGHDVDPGSARLARKSANFPTRSGPEAIFRRGPPPIYASHTAEIMLIDGHKAPVAFRP